MGQPMARDSAAHASTAGNGNTAPIDADDWEYEYDHNESEDFYFTLDLTTHVPNALVQAEASSKPRHKPQADGSARQSAAVDAPNGEDSVSSGEEDEPSVGQLQIVDLHTTRPLVKLDENVYDCSWSTDLGTQFHIAKAGDVDGQVRRAGTVLDIVGTSQTRLLGIPVTLQPRNNTRRSRTPGASANHALSIDGRTENEVDADEASEPSTTAPASAAEPGVPLQIDRTLVKHQAGAEQASFLERLSQIKLKKGEKDQIPVYSVKQYHYVDPAKQAELKKTGRELDAQRKAKAKEDEIVASGQRPRKRRRKLTHAQKGVERGYQPGAGRPARDTVSQRLGFHDEAPPSNRNGRWARPEVLGESGAFTMSGAPHSALAGHDADELTTTAEQAPETTTSAMTEYANPGSSASPSQERNEEIQPPEPLET